MKNKYVFTAVLLAVILFVGSVLTTIYVRTEQKQEQEKEKPLLEEGTAAVDVEEKPKTVRFRL